MEQDNALKQAESALALAADRTIIFQAKLEELLFRAQRISTAFKNGLKGTDSMFGTDLQHFRRDVKSFGLELASLPSMMGSLERSAEYSEAAVPRANAVMRVAARLNQGLHSFQDMAMLAHAHIREADHKIEAWYLVQEIEQMAQKVQGLPTVANKVVIRISTPPAPARRPGP